MLMKNTEFIGYSDLNRKPGFQMALYKTEDGRYFNYVAGFRHNGFNIVEVTDPANPVAKWMEGDWISDVHDGQSIPKLQIGDGKLIAFYGGTAPDLHGTPFMPFWGGFKIYDIAEDPWNPKFLGQFECAPPGAHRSFYNGGDYVYCMGGKKGFLGYILRIVDISDPSNPIEVGSYWDSGQYLNDKSSDQMPAIGSEEFMKLPLMHACTAKDDVVYLAAPNNGFLMIDVKDKSNPKFIGRLPLNPTFAGGQAGAAVHTAMPYGDGKYGLVSTEGERPRYFSPDREEGMFHKITTQAMGMIGVVELTDPKHPSLISIFPYPEVPEEYKKCHGDNFNIIDGQRVVFGPHNLFDVYGRDVYEPQTGRVYNAYFQAGLRIFDISDPFIPKEIGYFMPPDPEGPNWFDNEDGTLTPGPKVMCTEDVVVDDRGYIYVDTFQEGMYIVRYTGDDNK